MYQKVEAHISADGKVTKQTLIIKNINRYTHTKVFSMVTLDRYNLAPICLLLNLRDSFSLVHPHAHRFTFQNDRNNTDKYVQLFCVLYTLKLVPFLSRQMRLVFEGLCHMMHVKESHFFVSNYVCCYLLHYIYRDRKSDFRFFLMVMIIK